MGELLTITNILIIMTLIVNVITLIVVVMHIKNSAEKKEPVMETVVPPLTPSTTSNEIGVVFCRSCNKPYDSTLTICPDCKASRS